jgi:hypothetical protein
MVLINSLTVLPRHSDKVGIVIYDNLQAQEILRLNNKDFNTIFNISKDARQHGFIFSSNEIDGIKKWYLKTQDTRYSTILHYNNIFSTTYHLRDLEHYWECKHCLSAVPSTWPKCLVCS